MRSLPARAVCLSLLLLTASYVVLGIVPAGNADGAQPGGLLSIDTHSYFVPKMLYVWDSLRSGGGLFWNPYQNCGQPVFGISTTGLLYPPNLLYGLLDAYSALLAGMVFHLVVGGSGAYLLCRRYCRHRTAALCGALVFQLGGITLKLLGWSPIHFAGYAWLPLALWATEGVLRTPTPRGVILLASVLAVQLLPGYPQIAFFTYQLVLLRVAWALLTAETRRLRTMLFVLAALVLPPLLAAVQLLPSLAVAGESIRSTALDPRDLVVGARLTRATAFPALLAWPRSYAALGMIMLAGAAFSDARTRSTACFFLACGAFYFALSFGPGTQPFDLYASLPLGSMFRVPERFLWPVGLCLAVLAALGAERVLGDGAEAKTGALIGMLAAGVGFLWLRESAAPEVWWVGGVMLLALAAAGRSARLAAVASVALPLALFVDCVWTGRQPLLSHPPDPQYQRNAPAFEFARDRLKAGERSFVLGSTYTLDLMPKSASIFRVPSIHDYEPQVSRSYAEFFTYMRSGRPYRRMSDWLWVGGKDIKGAKILNPRRLQHRLLDLAAVRLLVVPRSEDAHLERSRTLRLKLAYRDDSVSIFENESTLPRAFFVPRVRVLAEEQVLPALVRGPDPRRVARLSEAPASGFTGRAGTRGSARILRDEPERVVVRVEAEGPGFLHLADQWSPGWTASVAGEPTEILRANHTFRLVEVPAGESDVTFRYRPPGLLPGAVLSGAAIACAVLVVLRSDGRDRGSTARS